MPARRVRPHTSARPSTLFTLRASITAIIRSTTRHWSNAWSRLRFRSLCAHFRTCGYMSSTIWRTHMLEMGLLVTVNSDDPASVAFMNDKTAA
jgi:hypothetical protein